MASAAHKVVFLDRASLLASLARDWRVAEEWVTDDEADIDATHRGFLLERKTP